MAPESSLEEGWKKKFLRTNPIVAVIEDKVVGFAEFEPDGHIDYFYCHPEWIGKGVGSALMNEIFIRAKNSLLGKTYLYQSNKTHLIFRALFLCFPQVKLLFSIS
ncbi:GNAT family N-acetyltransferase [Candidatus Protochlamydia sp. W-9]|uniref:GNAT family N-acetyltransferase n=1 Tax=Candidatus Protochlamydia sp. W-9 TaxID=1785087 RepID=UPI00096AC92E|nr:GNAT family N-acetyltransferase [Candidatus Protochlamydia sp. W-9]